MPEPLCSSTVETCLRSGSPDSCLFSPLSVTFARVARDACCIDCGEMSVGMHSGCVVGLNLSELERRVPVQKIEAMKACFAQRFLGTRWECAPEEGWISIYLGSCTVGP